MRGTLVLVATVIALGLLWQGATMIGWIDPFVVPPPAEILASLPALVHEENLAGRFLTTFFEAAMAGLLAVAVGVPLGWLLHRQKIAGLAFEPWVASAAAAPLVLLYPLFLVLIGRNILTIIVMGAVAGLPAIVLKTKEGFDTVRPVLLNVAKSFALSRTQTARMVLLPSAVPTLANGVRLALVFALINIVGVEFLVNFGGLGQLIADLSDRYEIPAMYGAVLFVILVSITFFVLTERIERWMRPV